MEWGARSRLWWDLLPPPRCARPHPAPASPVQSPRWPYIAALGPDLPCGWALPPPALAAALAGLGSLAHGWQPQVAAAAEAVQQRCEAAAAAYGPELGGLTAAEVRWALGHVASRCFGAGEQRLEGCGMRRLGRGPGHQAQGACRCCARGAHVPLPPVACTTHTPRIRKKTCPGDDLALLPFIDLSNHRQHAGTPQQ